MMILYLQKLVFIFCLLVAQSYLPIDASATAVNRKNPYSVHWKNGEADSYSKTDKRGHLSYRNKQYARRAAWILGFVALGNYSSVYVAPFHPRKAPDSLSALERNGNIIGLSAQKNLTLFTPREQAKSLAVVIRTWSEDAATAVVAAESALTQIPDLFELVIITDQDSAESVERELFQPLKELFGEDRPLKFIVEEPFLFNGHIQQKYSKMIADTYTDAEYIMHLDSDGAITHWEDTCFLRDNKPINDFDLWENLPDSVRQWREGTAFLLGVEKEDIKYEYSRINQHVYPRDLYKKVREELENIHHVSFKGIFTKYDLVGTGSDRRKKINSTLISDFNTLGAFAHRVFPGSMHQLDLSTGEKWRQICTTQCNARKWSNACCNQFRREQIESARRHKPIKAHLICSDYQDDHPCHCGNENKRKAAKRTLVKKNDDQPKGTKFFEQCITPTGTNGSKCGEDGYCYGNEIEDSCEKVVGWFEQQEEPIQYPDCICPPES